MSRSFFFRSASAIPPPPPPPPPGNRKWNPNLFVLSVGVNSSPNGNDRNKNEIPLIAAANAKYGTSWGYMTQYTWDFLYKGVGVVDLTGPTADFNAQQAACPGCPMGFAVAPYGNWIKTVTPSTVKVGSVPAFILADKNTYGAGPPGTSQGGYGFSNYNPTNATYGYVNSALWNNNVTEQLKLFFATWAKSPLTLSAGPYANRPYTWDTHPLVEWIEDWGPTDLNMNGSPINPANYSARLWQAQWMRRCITDSSLGMAAAWPHTNVALMPGFGANGPGGQQVTDQDLLISQMVSNKIAVSCTDVFPSGTASTFTWAQNYFTGLTTNDGGATWVPGGTDRRFKGASMPNVQGADYNAPVPNGGAKNSIAAVQAILDVCYNKLAASHVALSIASFTGATITLADFANFVAPGMASMPIPAKNRVIPSAYA